MGKHPIAEKYDEYLWLEFTLTCGESANMEIVLAGLTTSLRTFPVNKYLSRHPTLTRPNHDSSAGPEPFPPPLVAVLASPLLTAVTVLEGKFCRDADTFLNVLN